MSVEETNRYALAMQPVYWWASCVAEHMSTCARQPYVFPGEGRQLHKAYNAVTFCSLVLGTFR